VATNKEKVEEHVITNKNIPLAEAKAEAEKAIDEIYNANPKGVAVLRIRGAKRNC